MSPPFKATEEEVVRQELPLVHVLLVCLSPRLYLSVSPSLSVCLPVSVCLSPCLCLSVLVTCFCLCVGVPVSPVGCVSLCCVCVFLGGSLGDGGCNRLRGPRAGQHQ